MSLLPVAEAQARLLELATPLPVEELPVVQATGRYLAQDLTARRDQPWTALSSMDGYAVRSEERPGPWRITGESSAGGLLPPMLEAGQACRIFTGAPVPPGADAVLVQEDALVENGLLYASQEARLNPGRFVRRAAADFAAGDTLLPAGSAIGAAQVALAVLAGHATLLVRRRPKVALLSTGNELVSPGTPTHAGELPSSNAPMLAAKLASLPCDVIDLGIVRDDLNATVDALKRAGGADIVVTTGGASVGDHDLVKPAVEKAGGRLDFWKVKMRPGKPLMAGRIDDAVFLGLPGNPVSAFVTATLFLLPLVRHLSGAAQALPPIRQAMLASAVEPIGDRDAYLRARHVEGQVIPMSEQESSASFSLAQADCLIVRPAGSAPLEAGDAVTIIPFA